MKRLRGPALLCFLALALPASAKASAYGITSVFSPKNMERPKRTSTEYIILHTTEAPANSALRKLRLNGEAHYLVDRGGHTFRIIDHRRVAFHAGRSMWKGKTNLDNFSVGVEVEGYHQRPPTEAQCRTLRWLIQEMQRLYRIPDECVLSHSTVAYGAPNRWHPRSHRGRKRCGMLFAKRSVRLTLGLDRQPVEDPDVKAGRLVVGDPYLAAVLYGSAREQDAAAQRFAGADANVVAVGRSAWDIARDQYNSPDTVYVFPGGERRKGNEIGNWKAMPPGTRVLLSADPCENATEAVKQIGVDGATARDIAGDECGGVTTIYFLPDGRVRNGSEFAEAQLQGLPEKTRILVGYSCGGSVTPKKRAFDICGARWKLASTYYRLPDGSLVSGDKVNENAIPRGTLVFIAN